MIYLLIGYMWLFLHRPFEVWPWIGELHVERVYMIFTLAWWMLFADKRWDRDRFTFGFLLLAIAMLASAATSPFTNVMDVLTGNWVKIAIFYLLLITSVRTEKDLRVIVTAFVVCFGLYMLHSFREYLCGRYVWRMGTARMIGVDRSFNDPNTFGNSVVYALAMAWPAWTLISRKWHRWAWFGFVGLAVICILLTGSRSSFVAIVLLSMIAVALTKYRRIAFVCLLIATPIIWLSLSQNLKDRYMTIIDPSRGPASAQVSAEGRMLGFTGGMKLWRENPVLGVGPGAYGPALFHIRGHNAQAHNLYGQVMGELGSVGVIALVAILLACSLNMLEAWHIGRAIPELKGSFLYQTCLAVFVTWIMLLLLGWGGHNLYRYTWLWYGAFSGAALHLLRQRYFLNMSDLERNTRMMDDENDDHSNQCQNAPGDSTVIQGEPT